MTKADNKKDKKTKGGVSPEDCKAAKSSYLLVTREMDTAQFKSWKSTTAASNKKREEWMKGNADGSDGAAVVGREEQLSNSYPGIIEVHVFRSTALNAVYQLLDCTAADVSVISDFLMKHTLDSPSDPSVVTRYDEADHEEIFKKKEKSYCPRWFMSKISVASYEEWRHHFDGQTSFRAAEGLAHPLVLVDGEDPTSLTVLFETQESGFSRAFRYDAVSPSGANQ